MLFHSRQFSTNYPRPHSPGICPASLSAATNSLSLFFKQHYYPSSPRVIITTTTTVWSMYSPISDDDRPSARRHSIKARKDSLGADSIRKGIKGVVPRRRSSAAASRNSVLKVKRKRSPHIVNASKPAISRFDHLATYMVDRQISEHYLLLPTQPLVQANIIQCAVPYLLLMRDMSLEFSLIILSCFAAVHLLLPQYRSTTTKLFKISYHKPKTDLYGKGEDDIYFVSFWIVMFTFLRATAMDYLFTPLARRGGISTKRGLIRFAEQAWLLVYYSVFWTLGMVCPYPNSDCHSGVMRSGICKCVTFSRG